MRAEPRPVDIWQLPKQAESHHDRHRRQQTSVLIRGSLTTSNLTLTCCCAWWAATVTGHDQLIDRRRRQAQLSLASKPDSEDYRLRRVVPLRVVAKLQPASSNLSRAQYSRNLSPILERCCAIDWRNKKSEELYRCGSISSALSKDETERWIELAGWKEKRPAIGRVWRASNSARDFGRIGECPGEGSA